MLKTKFVKTYVGQKENPPRPSGQGIGRAAMLLLLIWLLILVCIKICSATA